MEAKVWRDAERIMSSPHILVAGTTGSGKSVVLNNLIASKMVTSDCAFAFIDLKRIELVDYRPTCQCVAYATEIDPAITLLDCALNIMEQRYATMEGKRSKDNHIYIVIDELADLVTSEDALGKLVRIGRLGRAANIHILAATQDPSRKTLSAQLMQNFTCCIALRCKTATESRQIINKPGAELLPRHGYGILSDADGWERIEIPFIEEEYVRALCTELTPRDSMERKAKPARPVQNQVAPPCSNSKEIKKTDSDLIPRLSILFETIVLIAIVLFWIKLIPSLI